MGLFRLKTRKNQANRGLCSKTRQSGGAIVWILVMIALFAALYFVVSSGFRTGETNLNKEKTDLVVTEILDYAEMLRRTAQTLQINGCRDTEISFETNAASGLYTNPNAPSDNSCHVFHPNGGGLIWQDPPNNSSEYNEFVITKADVTDVGTSNNGDPGRDIVLTLIQMNETVCRAINRKFGIPEVAGTVPEDNGDFVDGNFPGYYIGSFSGGINGIDGLANNCTGGNGPNREFCGKMTGCFKEETGNEYFIFYQVLVAR